MRFMEIHPAAFSLCVIGFGNIDGNQAIEMARQMSEAAVLVAHEIEAKRRTISHGHFFHGKTQTHKGVNDAAFGHFELVPTLQVAWQRQIWNEVIQTARDAKRIRIIRRHHPVANLVLPGIVANAIALVSLTLSQRPPGPFFGRLQGAHLTGPGQKTQRMTTLYTFHVFEENEIAATITMKCLQKEELDIACTG